MSVAPRIGVGGVVRRGDAVLLIRRRYVHGEGTWSTPGGALDFGETPDECALREIHEETGVVATRPHFIAITSDVFDAERHYITIWIGCDYASGEAAPVADYELSEVGWFRADALPEPLFLAFSHLVNGESLPPDAWRSV